MSKKQQSNKTSLYKIWNQKDRIENDFGKSLEWEELAEHRMSRIKYELTGVNLFVSCN